MRTSYIRYVRVSSSEGRIYLSKHLFLSESFDFSDSSCGSSLKLDLVESLMEVDGVVSGHRCDLFLFSFLCSRHITN